MPPHETWRSSVLINILAWVFSWCDEMHACVTQMDYELSKVYTNDTRH